MREDCTSPPGPRAHGLSANDREAVLRPVGIDAISEDLVPARAGHDPQNEEHDGFHPPALHKPSRTREEGDIAADGCERCGSPHAWDGATALPRCHGAVRRAPQGRLAAPGHLVAGADRPARVAGMHRPVVDRSRMTDDQSDQLERFEQLRSTDDEILRAELIEEHLWLARHLARRFRQKGQSLDDLEQVACLALVKAVDRFDPSFQVRFTTFAAPTIIGELRRHFRDSAWSVRVTRRLKELHLELKSVNEELTQQLGRTPSVDDLAEALEITSEEVLEGLEAGASYRASSLTPSSPDAPVIEPSFDDHRLAVADLRLALETAMHHLSDRDRRVLFLRYYLGRTQSEIADDVGLSQVHVSRILRSSLARLQEEILDESAISEGGNQ